MRFALKIRTCDALGLAENPSDREPHKSFLRDNIIDRAAFDYSVGEHPGAMIWTTRRGKAVRREATSRRT